MWFLLFVFVGARVVDGVSVCRPRGWRRRMGVARLCYRAAWVLCCCHSRTTRIARFHVRLETAGWHGNRRGRRGSRARVAAVLWHHSVECPAVTSSLRLRIACRTTEASLCSRASTVRSVLRYSLRRAGFCCSSKSSHDYAGEPQVCRKFATDSLWQDSPPAIYQLVAANELHSNSYGRRYRGA